VRGYVMELKFNKEFKSEKKEHPEFSNKVIGMIVKDHMRLEEKKESMKERKKEKKKRK
jgi:hypothetical protein